jgi:hypothetical protein
MICYTLLIRPVPDRFHELAAGDEARAATAGAERTS